VRPLRHPFVQRAAAAALAAYLRLTYRTLRWRWVNREAAEQVWAAKTGVLVCFWHGRLVMAPASWPAGLAQPPRVLISLSPDGEFIARAMDRLGFPAIRGSAGKKSDPAKAKGGSAAFRDVVRWLRGGGGVAVTPDGPRGPAEQMGEGVPMLARVSGAPTLLVGMACRPAIRFNSWDRAILPLPFGRAAIAFAGPLPPPEGDLTEAGRAWAERLSAVTAEAEAALA
jgi:lysophospholipid acyltransferase (LPLAT)-like uncharacterized protein